MDIRRSSGNVNQLVLGTQTPGTHVEPCLTAIFYGGNWMNIRLPAPLGVALGVADVVTKHGCFATYFTFHRLRILL